ncbi:hypothetical protein cypCar_00042415, partial [Cyprinus carpio]
ISYCDITHEGCAALASALRSNLRELDLTGNNLGEGGLTLLSDGLKDPHCKLEKLRLSDCDITAEGCAALASVLRSNPSHLRELDLTANNLGDRSVKLLSAGLKCPHCKLETLKLWDCAITDTSCAVLASALRSNPSHLRELNLLGNKLGYRGLKLLSVLKDQPLYKLETLLKSNSLWLPLFQDPLLLRKLSLWGLQMDLADELKKGLSLSCSSVMDENELLDDDAISLTSSDPAASALLDQSQDEQEMSDEDEIVETESSKSSCPAYDVLLEVMDHATARLDLLQKRVKKVTSLGCLKAFSL